jgi:NADH-quinone oxidoreductase subunit A
MNLLFILGFVIIGTVLLVGILLLSLLISPKPPKEEAGDKYEPYECGNLPFHDARVQFPTRYYFYLLLFLLFEVEAAFLIPLALVYKKLGLLAAVEGGVFLLLLLVAFLFALKEGVLDWLKIEEL